MVDVTEVLSEKSTARASERRRCDQRPRDASRVLPEWMAHYPESIT